MAFIWYAACVSLWEISDVFLWSGITDETVSIIHKAFALFSLSTPFNFMNFIYILLQKKRDVPYYTIGAGVVVGIFLMIFTDLYITRDVIRLNWGISPTPGSLYMPFMIIMFVVPVLYTIYIIRKKTQRDMRSISSTQLRLLSWSVATMLFTALIVNIVLPFILGTYRFPRIASSVIVFQSILLVLAITKYKFLSISDRHITEGMLRQIEDGIVLLDRDGYVIEMNEKAESILDVKISPIQETRGENLFAGRYPPEPEVMDREIILDRGANPLTVLVSKILIKQKGNHVGTLLVLRDITIRKQTEEALTREYNFKEAIINSSPAFLCTLSPSGDTISMNNSMLQALGYHEEDVQGRNFSAEFVPAQDREALAEVFQRITKGYEQVVYESRIIANDGRELLVEWHGRPVFNVNKELEFFIIVGIDITQRRRMEEELIRTHKLESLGVFAGGIAHDFNNLLTIVTGNLSLVMKRAPGPDTTAMLEEIEQAAQRARELTQQLLIFSKGGDPVIQETSIREVLAETVAFVIRGSRTRAEFSIPEDLWIVKADTGQIRQVIKNLAINALEAMPEGGVITVTAENIDASRVRMLNLPKGQYIRIAIKDSGAGIPDKDMKNIFDPYFSTKPGGQGLGLSIAASILKKHGGYLSASSEPGRGSLFEILLPGAERHAVEKESEPGVKRTRPHRVLLMDDEELILSLGKRMLAHLGCETTCAANGEEAIGLYKKAKNAGRPFDLVIMDLTIPKGMGGVETAQILKDYDKDVRAVVSSGYSNDPIMAHYHDYGFCDVIAKPYRINDIDELLNRLTK